MQLPVAPDREMIGQDLVVDEDEAVFAEMAVARGVVDIFDQIAIAAMLSQEIRERLQGLDPLEIVAAMRAGRPRQQRKRKRQNRLQRRCRDVGARIETKDFRDATALDARQQRRDRVARGAGDLAGIVDDRLAKLRGERGRERQFGGGLVGIRDEVDDHVDAAERSGVDPARRQQRQRVGVMGRIGEQEFGGGVAGKGRIQRQHAEIRRRLDGVSADQGRNLRGARISRLRTVDVAERLADSPDPVKTFAVIGVERRRLPEVRECRLLFIELVRHAPEPLPDLRVPRPLLDQLRQERLRNEVLPRRDQRLGQIGARRPMRRIELERLQIERNRALGVAGSQADGGKVAPAGRKLRRQPQRGLVAVGGGSR